MTKGKRDRGMPLRHQFLHTHTLLKKSLKKSKFSSETYQHWVSSNNGQVPRMVFGFLLCVFWLIDWLPGGWKKIKEMVTTGGEG